MLSKEEISMLLDGDYFEVTAKAGIFGQKLKRMIHNHFYPNRNNVEMPYLQHYCDGQLMGMKKNENASDDWFGDVGVSLEGWNWGRIIGPREESEYEYIDYFSYSTDFIESVYQVYELVVNNGGDFERLLRNEGNATDIQNEFVEYNMDCSVSEKEETERFRLCLLAAYYIDCSLWNKHFDEKYEAEMNGLFAKYYKDGFLLLGTIYDDGEEEDGIDAVEYIDNFLYEIEQCMTENEASYPILVPHYLNAHFSYIINEKECTQTFYFFTSKPLKEYRDLKELYPNNPHIKILDRFIPFLEDPAGMREHADAENVLLGAHDNCLMVSGYFGDEYVCGYGFYEWAAEGGLKTQVSPFFPDVAEEFMGILEDFKKEVVAEKQCIRPKCDKGRLGRTA